LRDQLRNREILEFERRAEISLDQPREIPPVLLEQRLIEPVGGLEVGLDFWRQRLLVIERPARGDANDKKTTT